THIGGDALQDGWRRLRSVEFLRNQSVNEALEIRFGGIARYDALCGVAGEIRDRLGIELAVTTMAAEQRRGYVGRSSRGGNARKMEIGIAPPIPMKTRATKTDARGLTPEQ